MISKWIISRDLNDLKIGMIIILLSFAGGYLVSDFPQEFLDIFSTPIGQFFIFFFINLISDTEKNPQSKEKTTIDYKTIIIESIASVLILQLLKYILRCIFPSKKP